MADISLISLSPPERRLDRALLEAPGGFLWWYVDLVDERGDGLVLIWSYGLPFLPGYTSAARRGRAQRPAERPSLNVSVYRGGRLDFYLLQEYRPQEVSWSAEGDRWRFGESVIETGVEDGRLRLRAELDCPVQGSDRRLTGLVEVEGVCRRPNGCESARRQAHRHDWTPRVGPASGRAELTCADHRWKLDGRAYHDRNGGSVPLDDLGIDYWLWGRVPAPGRELVYYLLWAQDADEPVAVGMAIDEGGATEVFDLDVELGGRRKNLGGLDWWETIALSRGGQPWLTVQNTDVVDSGPFYMRYITETTQQAAGEPVRGIGELVKPDRVDLAHHRPLVRMRVHDLDGDNSMWLPLFCGPKQGRVRRLVGSWLSGDRGGGGQK